jgi:hypothetical protein
MIVDMNKRSNSRPPWVWAALALQFAILSFTAYGCVQVLALWSRHTALGMGAQLAARVFFPAAMVAVSLIGLWRTRRWGWVLALVADGALCAQTLWFLLDYATLAVRNARFLTFSIWKFVALAVLVYRPVRDHFLQRNRVPRKATTPLVRAESGVDQAGKLLRILVYFAVAVVAACVATAFSLAFFMGQKNGGSRVFALFLYVGLMTGCVTSFLFILILTLVARKLGPARLWLWLLLGGLLAPGLIFVLASIGKIYEGAGPFNFVFWGPETLLQVWWLTLPAGVFTAWICYAIYPWSFSPSHQTSHTA